MKSPISELLLTGFLVAEAAFHGGTLTTSDILLCGAGWLVGGIIGRWMSRRLKNWWDARQERRELQRRQILSNWLN